MEIYEKEKGLRNTNEERERVEKAEYEGKIFPSYILSNDEQ